MKWEYRICSYFLTGAEEKMDEMGEQGWELVSAKRVIARLLKPEDLENLNDKRWGVLCFFKRRISSQDVA